MTVKSFKKKSTSVCGLIAFAVLLIISCKEKALTGKAELYNVSKENVGTVIFTETSKGVKLSIDIKKLPAGVHAFHIHGKGGFTSPDFKAAGGHFNPFNKEHGLNNSKGPHAGDLPNIKVKDDGTYMGEVIAELVTLMKGKKNSLIRENGTSIIIHQKGDDNKSNPSGNAGPRIAGGTIK